MTVQNMPFDVDAFQSKYGKILWSETPCPGIYYVGAQPNESATYCMEYYIVTKDSPAISDRARNYGEGLPGEPGIVVFDSNDYFEPGRHIVRYEILQYQMDHNLPIPEGESLESARIHGMEICPDYFGEFPLPEETPWGPPVQQIRLANGLFWLRTETSDWMLAVAYPLCEDIREDVLLLAQLTEYDQTNGIDHTFGYRFFSKASSCLAIHCLMMCSDLNLADQFDTAALNNAIIIYYPEWVAQYNLVASGLEDQIIQTENAGMEFYQFPL